MKKFILGLIAGVAIMMSGSVFADEIAAVKNMIGKTIVGQFDVTVDGDKLPNPAIVVDGTSYLPVRSFAESVGFAVYFDTEGGVKLERQISVAEQSLLEAMTESPIYTVDDPRNPAIAEAEQMAARIDAVNATNGEIVTIVGAIEINNLKIKRYTSQRDEYVVNPEDSEAKQKIQADGRQYYQDKIDPLAKENAELEQQLAPLRLQLEALQQ